MLDYDIRRSFTIVLRSITIVLRSSTSISKSINSLRQDASLELNRLGSQSLARFEATSAADCPSELLLSIIYLGG
jgi:hypothetical protein